MERLRLKFGHMLLAREFSVSVVPQWMHWFTGTILSKTH